MRLIFLGTPDFAVPALQKIAAAGHRIAAVVTQPDRRRNRGEISFSPVKEAALKLGLEVLQFQSVKKEGVDILKNLRPDIMVTAAFGQILSQEILDIAKYGVINVHASLLPAYRGAAPIQRAIMDGCEYTGISIMQTALKVDSGPVILQKKVKIGEDETAEELFLRLAATGGDAVCEALSLIESGKAVYTEQDESKATFCGIIKKEDGEINFDTSFFMLKRFINAMTPWPSAYTNIEGKRFKILAVERAEGRGVPGCVLKADRKNGLVIALKEQAVKILKFQPENKSAMRPEDYFLGNTVSTGITAGKV